MHFPKEMKSATLCQMNGNRSLLPGFLRSLFRLMIRELRRCASILFAVIYSLLTAQYPLRSIISRNIAIKFTRRTRNCPSTGPVHKIHGLNMISGPLYVKGVSRLFAEVVSDMLQLVIIAVPKSERPHLEWSVQFINPHVLEDKYVSVLLSDTSDNEIQGLQPNLREDYLRNRFRSYMNRFQLYKSEDTPLKFNIELEEGQIIVHES